MRHKDLCATTKVSVPNLAEKNTPNALKRLVWVIRKGHRDLNNSGAIFPKDFWLQCSCLENPMDGGAWWATVHGVAKSRTWLSDFTFTFHFPALEKEMATHSSVLAWRIPGTEEPGGLPSMGSHRVGHDWSDLAAAAAERNTLCGILHNWLHYI